ncbi:MAG: dipeptide epimerase [Candidatus Coatesbacteria bacterium]
MRIIRATVFPVAIPMRAPLVLAYATRTACRACLLRLEADDGTLGWGEAVPVREVTGERLGDVREALGRVATERLVCADPMDAEVLRLVLQRDLASLPSARCAASTALADLRARALGLPLARLLGGAREAAPACLTLGLADEATTIASARSAVAAGFPVVKLKVGVDPAADAARVIAVRKALGSGTRLLADANQGYTLAGALDFADRLRSAGVELLEQPVAAVNLEGLFEVARRSPVPVAADEAVTGPASLARVLAGNVVKAVNVKLQKCGGPDEAALMVRMAEAAGVPVMVGCMIETRVSISAGLAVALGLANVRWIDLDGAFGLEADPVVAGGARMTAGAQHLGPEPGLGVEVDEAVLERYRDAEPSAP